MRRPRCCSNRHPHSHYRRPPQRVPPIATCPNHTCDPCAVARAPLTPEEVEDYWALGIPIEATYVPADIVERAIAEKRVEGTSSWSSMGTAETYWERIT